MQRKVFALFASKLLSLSIDPCRIEIKSAEISLSSGHILTINLDVSLFGSRIYAQMSFCTLRHIRCSVSFECGVSPLTTYTLPHTTYRPDSTGRNSSNRCSARTMRSSTSTMPSTTRDTCKCPPEKPRPPYDCRTYVNLLYTANSIWTNADR
jgi:hypothetical protein